MAALIKDRDTQRRAGYDFHLPVAAGKRIFSGAVVCLNATGYATPAITAEGLKFPALAIEGADNSAGANGDILVAVERTVVGLDCDVSVTRAVIGQKVFLVDDHTVTATASGKSPAGLLVDLQDGQAWVDLTR